MTPAFVRLPVGMTTPDGGKEVECHGATVREVIDEAIAVEPRMRARIFREDGRMFAGVFLNGRNINAAGRHGHSRGRRRQAHRRPADVRRLTAAADARTGRGGSS